ncbi:YebC/PmpR family DNA-binding transcriptional regulator, partial [Candidatus Peregrinibacteria bacterium]|nr:YebC/PmpR family DNA-binding transcriptional regulator [Candidatus Peregrinibacteria bacterium]
TDNKNRAFSNIKTTFAKNGGNMGEAGSVGWMFEKKGIIIVKVGDKNPEESELEIIEAGAEDLEMDGDTFEVITDASSVMQVRDDLEKAGFEIAKAEQTYLPKDPIEIKNLEDAKKIIRLMELIEDDEDVSDVYSNFDISEDLMTQID